MSSSESHPATEVESGAKILLELQREGEARAEAAVGLVLLRSTPPSVVSPPRTMHQGQIPNELFSSDSDAAKVLSAIRIGNPNAHLRDSLWYLEANNFVTEIAIQNFEFDTIDRTSAPIALHSTNEVKFQAENPAVDRSLALPGDDFDSTKLRLVITRYSKSTSHTFPNAAEFDKNNIEHVKELNRWRHDKIRSCIGRVTQSDRGYHPVELAFLEENLMQAALKSPETRASDYKMKIDYRTVTQLQNDYFAGQMLPGAWKPAPTRSQSSVTRVWNTQHFNKQSGSNSAKHLKAGEALRDSGKFKARRIKVLKALGRPEDAAALEANTPDE